MADNVQKLIAQTFLQIADGIASGSFEQRPRIGITGIGSEHGEQTVMEGALKAALGGVDVTYFGTLTAEGVRTVQAADEEAARKEMERMLDAHELDGAVTMHYPFPIGVSTVGRVVTPGRGREMFLATTTGTSSADRVTGMVKNAIYGIIAAKACGIAQPTVGILNVDGARATEGVLKQLIEGGYPLQFATSQRADGGCVMRGNDLLTAACDVMVTDPLTGNVLTKALSAFSTGGSYEAVGYGYGPGIGQDYSRLILIISRASGAPVIANALVYAAQLVRGRVHEVAAAEFAAAEKAGLSRILQARQASAKPAEQAAPVALPPKEVVTAQIPGIEITDIEDAVMSLMKEGIYAESGMGCTGPIVLVSEANHAKAKEILQKGGYVSA